MKCTSILTVPVRAGWRIVLLLDEFERLLQGISVRRYLFQPTAISCYRSHALAWVTASRHDPFLTADGPMSPFGNTFLPPLWIGRTSS